MTRTWRVKDDPECVQLLDGQMRYVAHVDGNEVDLEALADLLNREHFMGAEPRCPECEGTLVNGYCLPCDGYWEQFDRRPMTD